MKQTVGRYEVSWPSHTVTYITGPGVDVLRLDDERSADGEDVALALDNAFEAGAASKDGSAQLAAVRELLGEFNWEFDDRQLALEAIQRIVTGEA